MVATPLAHPVFLGISHKMYLDPIRTMAWSRAVAELAAGHPGFTQNRITLAVLPSIPSLQGVLDIFQKSSVSVGAQDLFYEDRGAFTGAVSGQDLAMLGCRYVEIGHAERRALGDDDVVVRRKLVAARRNGLIPILCIGEPEPGPGATDWCVHQLAAALARFADQIEPLPLVIAYEPVWAIGQAEAASLDHVRTITAAIRDCLAGFPPFADTTVIYGGSAGPGTLGALGDTVDGLFLGRFAHDPAALATIFDEAAGLMPVRAQPRPSHRS